VPAAEVQSGSSPGPQDVKGKHTLVQLKKNDRLKVRCDSDLLADTT
jgi:hypothetical protein